MATRSTFQKRQKEMRRMEKQRMKAARRAERKLAARSRNEAPPETPAVDAPAGPEPQA